MAQGVSNVAEHGQIQHGIFIVDEIRTNFKIQGVNLKMHFRLKRGPISLYKKDKKNSERMIRWWVLRN